LPHRVRSSLPPRDRALGAPMKRPRRTPYQPGAIQPQVPESPSILQGRGLKAWCHARDVLSMGRAFSPPPERARGWAWSSWAAGPDWYPTGTLALGTPSDTRRCFLHRDSYHPTNRASPASVRGLGKSRRVAVPNGTRFSISCAYEKGLPIVIVHYLSCILPRTRSVMNVSGSSRPSRN
jgi:hypothetical protein